MSMHMYTGCSQQTAVAYRWILLPDAVVKGICKGQPDQVWYKQLASKGIHLVKLTGCHRCQGKGCCNTPCYLSQGAYSNY